MAGAGEHTADGTPPGGADPPLRPRHTERGVVLEAHGDFDVANAKYIRGALAQVLATGPEVLVVDMSDVTFISSVGLSLLVEAHADAGPGVFRVVTGDNVALRVITLTGLTAILATYDTVRSALAAP